MSNMELNYSTDLISRSSLLAKYDKEHEGPPGRARKLIEEEPPVWPKRGYWIKTGDKEEAYGTVSKCSVCGVIDYEGNFCPNCGADMRGEQDG